MAQTGSFIPNQPARRPTKVRHRRVYILSYIVYTIFFGVLLTVAALFVWEWQLNGQLAAQQAALDEQRNSFSQSDISRVNETEDQLQLVEYILDLQPAVSQLFVALEETTVGTVQLSNLKITADGLQAGELLATYTGQTDSFNSVLAQRKVMEASSLLSDAEVVNVKYGSSAEDEGQSSVVEVTARNPVTYEVTLLLPVSSLMPRLTTTVPATEPVATGTGETTDAPAAVGFVEETEVDTVVDEDVASSTNETEQ